MSMTFYQAHCRKWAKCKRCPLWESRNKIVLARGSVPAPILFIGEAPGASENVLGAPFVGPAGKLLDYIINQSITGRCPYAITNLIACLPTGIDGSKMLEPSKENILACAPRLQEFVRMCKPDLAIYVGKLASTWTPKVLVGSVLPKTCISIIHPAAILRMDVSQKGLAIQRSVVAIQDALEES